MKNTVPYLNDQGLGKDFLYRYGIKSMKYEKKINWTLWKVRIFVFQTIPSGEKKGTHKIGKNICNPTKDLHLQHIKNAYNSRITRQSN